MSRYTSATDADRQEMLDAIGVASIDELFDAVPEGVRLDRPLDLPLGHSLQPVCLAPLPFGDVQVRRRVDHRHGRVVVLREFEQALGLGSDLHRHGARHRRPAAGHGRQHQLVGAGRHRAGFLDHAVDGNGIRICATRSAGVGTGTALMFAEAPGVVSGSTL